MLYRDLSSCGLIPGSRPGHETRYLETFVKIFSAQIKSYKNCGSCITMS